MTMVMEMVEMKEKRLVQQRDLCLVQPKEVLKGTSWVYLMEDWMVLLKVVLKVIDLVGAKVIL